VHPWAGIDDRRPRFSTRSRASFPKTDNHRLVTVKCIAKNPPEPGIASRGCLGRSMRQAQVSPSCRRCRSNKLGSVQNAGEIRVCPAPALRHELLVKVVLGRIDKAFDRTGRQDAARFYRTRRGPSCRLWGEAGHIDAEQAAGTSSAPVHGPEDSLISQHANSIFRR